MFESHILTKCVQNKKVDVFIVRAVENLSGWFVKSVLIFDKIKFYVMSLMVF